MAGRGEIATAPGRGHRSAIEACRTVGAWDALREPDAPLVALSGALGIAFDAERLGYAGGGDDGAWARAAMAELLTASPAWRHDVPDCEVKTVALGAGGPALPDELRRRGHPATAAALARAMVAIEEGGLVDRDLLVAMVKVAAGELGAAPTTQGAAGRTIRDPFAALPEGLLSRRGTWFAKAAHRARLAAARRRALGFPLMAIWSLRTAEQAIEATFQRDDGALDPRFAKSRGRLARWRQAREGEAPREPRPSVAEARWPMVMALVDDGLAALYEEHVEAMAHEAAASIARWGREPERSSDPLRTVAGRRREPWARVPARYDGIAVRDVLREAGPSVRLAHAVAEGVTWNREPMTLGDFLRDPVGAQRALMQKPNFGVRSLAEALEAIDARVAVEVEADEARRLERATGRGSKPSVEDLADLRELGPDGVDALLEWGRVATALSVGLERAALLHVERACRGLETRSPKPGGDEARGLRRAREIAYALMLGDDATIARRIEEAVREAGTALATAARAVRGPR